MPAPTTYSISFIRRDRSEWFGFWSEKVNLNVQVRELYEFANDPFFTGLKKKQFLLKALRWELRTFA